MRLKRRAPLSPFCPCRFAHYFISPSAEPSLAILPRAARQIEDRRCSFQRLLRAADDAGAFQAFFGFTPCPQVAMPGFTPASSRRPCLQRQRRGQRLLKAPC